jgi:hypothetical protein
VIESTGYRLSCDEVGCMAEEFAASPKEAHARAREAGWVYDVMKGADYCPAHQQED